MLNDIKIGPKLTGGFALGALLTLAMGLLGIHAINKIQAGQDRLFQEGVQGMRYLAKANIAFQRNRVRVRDMIRHNEPEQIEAGDTAIEKYIKEVSENMTAFNEYITTEDVRVAFKEFGDNRGNFLKNLNEMRRLAKEGKDQEAFALLDGEGKQTSDIQQALLIKLMDLTVAHATATDDSSDAESQSTKRTFMVLMIASLIASLTMGLVLTNSITGPLKAGVVMMNSLFYGHLQRRLHLSRRDEIGELGSIMDKFADNMKDSVVNSLAKLAAGDVTVQLTPKDDRDEISPALNKTAESLRGLIAESKTLTTAALEGRLSTRGDVDKFQGGYREIVQGVNDTLDAVIKPVQDAAAVLERIANKDMTARVTADYQGDHAKIKEAVNVAAETLDQSLQQVAVGADQIASASGQIGTGAQALAQGTSEQASSLEEVSSSLQEMTAMTRQNSANAKEARGIAEATKTSAENGVGSMQRLSAAMDLIKKSSDDTAKIIKTIDEIAFQTNLLALNAAVEAARAGEAGKGFAVVAEEVRNLAMRSAEAAKNTANMIEGSVKNSENGVVINHEVMKNLEEINGHARRVSEVMAEIAAASDQQSQGVGQVNTAMEQMNQLTQQNAANSEESASASEELSAQAQEMRAMVSGFKISGGGGHSAPSSHTPHGSRSASAQSAPIKMVSKKSGKSEEVFPLETAANGQKGLESF
jgi:methyl-accepting chemotaxis protein